jgi:hypothetical protein
MKKNEGMTVEEMRRRGRELMRLATQKEAEIRNRQLIQIGEIFKREIEAGWPTSWEDLAEELESIFDAKIGQPAWSMKRVQGGGNAPLVSAEEREMK